MNYHIALFILVLSNLSITFGMALRERTDTIGQISDVQQAKTLCMQLIDKLDQKKVTATQLAPEFCKVLMLSARLHLLTNMRLLAEYARLTVTDSQGNTPLHWAVFSPEPEDTCEALDLTIKQIETAISQRISNSTIPLTFTTASFVDTIVEEFKLSPTTGNTQGDTPLHVAAARGNCDALFILERHGAQLDVQNNDGNTPFHLAALHNQPEALMCLTTLYGAAKKQGNALTVLSVRNKAGNSALHLAASNGHLGVVRLLADTALLEIVNGQERTALHEAADRETPEIASYLLAQGANSLACETFGNTPLHLAVAHNKREIIKLFMNSSAAKIKNIDKNTALHLAARLGDPETIALLVNEIKAPLDETNKNGDTALHIAVTKNYSDAVKRLVECGASCEIHNAKGLTPLHVAVEADNRTALKCFLKKSISPNTLSLELETPLHLASSLGKIGLLKLLLKHKADKESKNQNGETPLHKAALAGQTRAALILVAYGANIHTIARTGKTPLQAAMAAGKNETAANLSAIDQAFGPKDLGPRDTTAIAKQKSSKG